jgi:fibronectin type 3 domain-containing protein
MVAFTFVQQGDVLDIEDCADSKNNEQYFIVRKWSDEQEQFGPIQFTPCTGFACLHLLLDDTRFWVVVDVDDNQISAIVPLHVFVNDDNEEEEEEENNGNISD